MCSSDLDKHRKKDAVRFEILVIILNNVYKLTHIITVLMFLMCPS